MIHTKGEWIKSSSSSLYQEISDFEGNVICSVHRFDNDEESKANAKLIASAPEMKLALEKIIEMNYKTAEDQYGDKSKADNWSCVIVAKEALKKATE